MLLSREPGQLRSSHEQGRECRRGVRGCRRRRRPPRRKRRLCPSYGVRADHQCPGAGRRGRPGLPGGYKHLVVIYEENHCFDNLYGGWGAVDGQRSTAVARRPRPARPRSTRTARRTSCLLQNDVNLDLAAAAGRPARTPRHGVRPATSPNEPFPIDDYIGPTRHDLPGAGRRSPPTACSKDTGAARRLHPRPGAPLLPGAVPAQRRPAEPLRHRLGRGRADDGHYDTRSCRSTTTCTARAHPHYVHRRPLLPGGLRRLVPQPPVADRRGARPVDTSGGAAARRPALGRRRATACRSSYPLYTPTGPAVDDGQLTRAVPDPAPPDYARPAATSRSTRPAVQPAVQRPTGAKIPLIDDAKYPNIGDRLSARRISWAWYSGGWDDAAAGHPGPAVPVPPPAVQLLRRLRARQAGPRATCGTRRSSSPRRTAGARCRPVSFVKPFGAENEHPGYASEPTGSDHLVDLLKAVTNGPQRQGHAGRRDLRRVRRPVGPRRRRRARARDAGRPRRAGAPAPASRRSVIAPVDCGARASTTRRTTRPRSWRRSSTASGCRRCPAATRRSTTCRTRWPGAGAADPNWCAGPDVRPLALRA